MDRKTGYLIFSALLILLPILGASSLYYLVDNIDQEFDLKYSVEEVIEQIENAEDLETMKKVALYIYMLQTKVIQTQQDYLIRLIHIVMVIGILNGILAYIFYRVYLGNNQ